VHVHTKLKYLLTVKLFQASTKDVNGAWKMDSPIEFENVANEENEQEFNAKQAKDAMSECESDSSSCAGSELILKLSLKHICLITYNQLFY
jgi:hypothetical protein